MGVGDINRKRTATDFLLTTTSSVNGDPEASGLTDQVDNVVLKDDDRELELIRQILVNVHSQYFSQLPSHIPDVKQIITEYKESVLQNVSITFSGIIPVGLLPEKFELWRLARMFGATCSESIISGITHLITFRTDTDKVLRAVEAGLIIVRPEWLLQCFREWQHVDEAPYLVKKLPPPKDVYLSPEDVRAMNAELAELEDGDKAESDEEDDDKAESDKEDDDKVFLDEEDEFLMLNPPPSKRVKEKDRLSSSVTLSDSEDSFIKELEDDLL